jgi:hypothetical protein
MVQMYKTVQPICKYLLDDNNTLKSQIKYTVIILILFTCEHSRINILQWILNKLGTYLVLKIIWNPIDFQGQRSMSLGQIFTA